MLLPPLFSCVAPDIDLGSPPVCDCAAATPPNPTTAATATVANNLLFMLLSSCSPEAKRGPSHTRNADQLSHVLKRPTPLRLSRSGKFRIENQDVPGTTVGTAPSAFTLAVLTGHNVRYVLGFALAA